MNPPPSGDLNSKLTMQGIHVELTEPMQQAIRDKFSILMHHNDHIVAIHVRLQMGPTMGHEHLFTATGQIQIRGPELVATAEGKDPYGVIDGLADKLCGLMDRRHELRKDKRNHPHAVEFEAEIPKVGER